MATPHFITRFLEWSDRNQSVAGIGAVMVIISSVGFMTDASLFRWFGTVPKQSMIIDSYAGWLTTSGKPILSIAGKSTRIIDCPEGTLFRYAVYDDGSIISIAPFEATRRRSLADTVTLTKAVDPVVSFAHLYELPRTDGLLYIDFKMFASPGQCADGQKRAGESLGIINVPPLPTDISAVPPVSSLEPWRS